MMFRRCDASNGNILSVDPAISVNVVGEPHNRPVRDQENAVAKRLDDLALADRLPVRLPKLTGWPFGLPAKTRFRGDPITVSLIPSTPKK